MDELARAQVLKSHHVGFAGMRTTEGQAYDALLFGDEPEQGFLDTYERGSVVGKLYALCGLHELVSPHFERLAAELEDAPAEEVQTFAGCIVDRRLSHAIILEIRGGLSIMTH